MIHSSMRLLALVSMLLSLIGCGGGGSSGGGDTTYAVTASAAAGGTISPTSVSVADGQSTSFTVTPDEGYSANVSGCGGTLTGGTYITGPITANCTVTATFEPATYNVAATTEGTGGSISPGSTVVSAGAVAVFVVTPEPGHTPIVSGCDGTLDGHTYTTGPITTSCTVTARFDFSVAMRLAGGHERVTVAWEPVEGATDYTICYSTDAGNDPDNCSPGGAAVTNAASPHVIEGLENGTTYYVTVTANMPGLGTGPRTERPATPGVLNDTGIVDTDPWWPAGQDAEHGRDAAAAAGTLYKVGAGGAGFDFTRICMSGETEGEGNCQSPELGALPNDWGCTRDNHTGLTWELKVDDETHLRHLAHRYTWYNPDEATNGGVAGNEGTDTCNGTLPEGKCNTHAYAAAVSALNSGAGFCGCPQWRLPTAAELHGLRYYNSGAPLVDKDYFPNTSDREHWTSTSHADGRYAMYVSFDNSTPVNRVGKDGVASRIRLVCDN